MNSLVALRTQQDDFEVQFEVISPIISSVILNPRQAEIARKLEDVDAQLELCEQKAAELNREIDRLTNHADGLDYSISVISGLITGVIDSFFVGQWDFQNAKAIYDLRSIKDQGLWQLLLQKKIIAYTEKNLIAYWTMQNKVDPVFVTYLNEFHDAIDFTACRESATDTVLKNFFVSLVKCNSIRNKQYKECVVSLGFEWGEEFNVSGLSIDKIQILAENHVLQMTTATLRFLRNNYAEALPTYIECNFDEYSGIMTSQLMSHQELLMILKWNVPDEAKKKLIDMEPSSISIVENKYSPEISAYILQKKANPNDIPQLYETYDGQPDVIKDYLYTHAIKNIDSIIRGTTKASTELKCRILSDDQTASSVKQRLLTSAVKTLSQADAILCLDAAQRHEFSKIFNPRTRPKIENNTQSKEILDVFKFRGWIAGYSLNADNSGYEIQRSTSPRKRTLTPV